MITKLKGLFVVPENPRTTFWGYGHILWSYLRKKEVFLPLTELTVAAMLIEAGWDVRVVDQNVETLTDEDLEWADYVLTSGMAIHKESIERTIARCQKVGVKVIGGGPFLTLQPEAERTKGIDHLILNEAELTLPPFLLDLKMGKPKALYEVSKDERGDYAEFADLAEARIPAFHLVDLSNYQTAMLQYSRGCPFGCDFCCVCVKDGKKTRCKAPEQFIAEVQALYDAGWKEGTIFINCDNVAGNRKDVREMLPALIEWQKAHGYPYRIMVQCDVAVPDDILQLFHDANIDRAFLGIESPEKASLHEVSKNQNARVDPVEVVRKFASHGIRASSGFMVGFDNDDRDIFDKMIQFVKELSIPEAMLGALAVLDGTPLKERLAKEGRLLGTFIGENADNTNFIPKNMSIEELQDGVKRVRTVLFTPENYYRRIEGMIKWLGPNVKQKVSARKKLEVYLIFLRSSRKIGFSGRGYLYWRLLFKTLLTKPRAVAYAVHQAVAGEHYFRIAGTVEKR